MPDLVEREEGLFSRHGVTRALCIVAAASWVLMVGFVLYFVVLVLLPSDFSPPGFGHLFLLAIAGAGAWLVSVGILWVWRKCDRCRKRLFSDSKPHFLKEWMREMPWRLDWLPGMTVPQRDHRAAIFMESYRSGAIWSMALKGRLRCQWCGHEDGATPEYMVNSGE